MKEYVIAMTQDDIAAARQENGPPSTTCAVAQAIKRVVGTDDVVCGFTFARVNGVVYTGPQEMLDFINKFDAGHPVTPITFTMTEDV